MSKIIKHKKYGAENNKKLSCHVNKVGKTGKKKCGTKTLKFNK